MSPSRSVVLLLPLGLAALVPAITAVATEKPDRADLAFGEPVVLRGHEKGVNRVVYNPDGKRLASADDGTVRLWDLDGKEVAVLRGHTDEVFHVSSSPDGRLASAGKEIAVLRHADLVRHVAFSPDGQRLASASRDGTVRLWDRDGKTITVLKGHAAASRRRTVIP
jgi:WD40 repeat protein